MRKQTPKLDWQVCEVETEWRATNTAWQTAQPSRPVRRTGGPLRRWRWWLGIALLALLPVLVEGYREVRRADQEMTKVENEVRASVVASLTGSARQQALLDRVRKHAEPSPAVVEAQGLEARRIEIRGEYAMVEVWTTVSDIPWLPAPYRQTRFYREAEQGWPLVAPASVFWEPFDVLQVGRFTFVFGHRDAAAVWETARHVEEMDAELRTELGMPLADEMLIVRFSQSSHSSLDPTRLAHLSRDSTLYVPSPALLPLPASISEGDALLQLVAGLLVERNLDEAWADSRVCHWQDLTDGLGLWLLWERSELPSLSRYQVQKFFHNQVARHVLPRLISIGPDYDACSPDPYARGSQVGPTRDGAATAYVEYAISAYGRDRLPALIDGMKRFDSWEELIPVVFGVSAAEFEAGWQESLR